MPVHDNSSVEIEGTGKEHFSIWVSFAEIYNEFIYDLLSDSPVKGKLRTNLKLQDDRNHNQFIRGEQGKSNLGWGEGGGGDQLLSTCN